MQVLFFPGRAWDLLLSFRFLLCAPGGAGENGCRALSGADWRKGESRAQVWDHEGGLCCPLRHAVPVLELVDDGGRGVGADVPAGVCESGDARSGDADHGRCGSVPDVIHGGHGLPKEPVHGEGSGEGVCHAKLQSVLRQHRPS